MKSLKKTKPNNIEISIFRSIESQYLLESWKTGAGGKDYEPCSDNKEMVNIRTNSYPTNKHGTEHSIYL